MKKLIVFFGFILALMLMVITIPKISVNATEGKFWTENENVEQSEEIVYVGTIEEHTFYIKLEEYVALVSLDQETWAETPYRKNGNSLYLELDGTEYLLVINDNNTLTYTGYYIELEEDDPEEPEGITKEDIEEIIDKALVDAGLNAKDIQNIKEMYATITNPDLTIEQKILYIIVVVLAAIGVSFATVMIFKKSLEKANTTNNKQVQTLIDTTTNLIDKADESIKAANLTQEQVNSQGVTIKNFIDLMQERDAKISELITEGDTNEKGTE